MMSSTSAMIPKKIQMISQLRRVSLVGRADAPIPAPPADPVESIPAGPLRIVCIGASTGGPPAIKQIFAGLPGGLPLAIVVSQHMPASFTSAFAERLDRSSAFTVRLAHSGDRLQPGLALVAPGAGSIAFERDQTGAVRVCIEPPETGKPRYVPSIDRMMESAAEVFGPDVLAIVLTGMGDDGRYGIKAVKAAGGQTMAESEATAVIFGMPEEAISTGAVDRILPLDHIATAMIQHARGGAAAAVVDGGKPASSGAPSAYDDEPRK
jgi:two-component system chemotaxis response regulator CheB